MCTYQFGTNKVRCAHLLAKFIDHILLLCLQSVFQVDLLLVELQQGMTQRRRSSAHTILPSSDRTVQAAYHRTVQHTLHRTVQATRCNLQIYCDHVRLLKMEQNGYGLQHTMLLLLCLC